MRSGEYGAKAVLFSPHLDDAALSASVQLQEVETRLVTVFAGMPAAGISLTDYDRMTGATSSAERFQERLLEDDRAMDVLGRPGVRIGALDSQYRIGSLEVADLQELLRPHTDQASEVWVPAAIGGHPDHLATRQAAIAVAAPEADIYLYADVPYSLRHGWPAWVTGCEDPAYLDVGFWLDQKVRHCGLDPELLTAKVFKLTPEERKLKELSVLAYQTQLPALRLSPDDPARWDAVMSYEVAWRLQR